MSKSLREQLSYMQIVLPPSNSRPRCMCHNLYLSKCPKQAWDCICGTRGNYGVLTKCPNCKRKRGVEV